jgi:murein tripeptide amidase MpaA
MVVNPDGCDHKPLAQRRNAKTATVIRTYR